MKAIPEQKIALPSPTYRSVKMASASLLLQASIDLTCK